MENQRNSYNSILKSISIFGGVKVIQILLSLVKNKFVAIILGPTGMGISGMIISSTSLIKAITNFGLHTTSVREIAQVTNTNNEKKVPYIASVVQKLILITGLLGCCVTFILSKQLSELSFGNADYSSAFKIVSIALLLDQLWVGQNALLQGTFHYKLMAKSAILGSIIGIFITIPCYYVWGNSAIAPVIVFSSLISFVCTYFYSKKLNIKTVHITYKQALSIGKIMLTLGLALSCTSIINTGSTFVLRSFISRFGVIADVGLYAAGIAIANQYVDVILQSMGSDYSPRLAAVVKDRDEFILVINRQIKLLIIIVTPLIVPFIVFIREVTLILYSDQFIPITGMIEWIMVGMFFRTISWCLSYSIIAMGETKKIMINEILTALYSLTLSILGYIFFNFTGLGLAFCLTYIFYTIHMYIVCRKSFSILISKDVLLNTGICLIMLVVSVIILKITGYTMYRYIIGILLILTTGFVTYHMLNKLIPLKGLLKGINSKANI